jgi:hypothetical protein
MIEEIKQFELPPHRKATKTFVHVLHAIREKING